MKSKLMSILCLIYAVGLVFFAINYDKIKQLGKEDVKTEETASVDSFSGTQCIEGNIRAHAKDLYGMDLSYEFSYDIVDPERLYMTFGAVYKEKVIKPIVENVVVLVVGEYSSADDCLRSKEKIVSDIKQKLTDEISSVVVVDMRVKFGWPYYGSEFVNSVEQGDLNKKSYTTTRNHRSSNSYARSVVNRSFSFRRI